MSFNNRSRLDPSQVEDRRGRRGPGTVIALGGGGLGLIITIVIMLLGGNLTGSTNGDAGQVPLSTESAGGINDLEAQCQTGADANTRQDCRIVGFVNSIQSFWTDEFARRGSQYTPADTVLFTGSTEAACGYASGAMGPFYCPTRKSIWTSTSSMNYRRALAPKAVRSPRRMCLLMSTAITCRTCLVHCRAAQTPQGQIASQFKRNSRRTAWPASGHSTPPRPVT